MKLYYTPGACSFAPHIALYESGLPFEISKVNLGEKKTAEGGDYLAVNPKGPVPALETPGGVLTEVGVILQYIADHAQRRDLGAGEGALAQYRYREMLNFIATEMHKGFSQYFNKEMTPEARKVAEMKTTRALNYLNDKLSKQAFLLGERYSVADSYFFTILTWAPAVKIDLSAWPAIQAYQARVGERPAVKQAQAAEKAA
ncbi:MAG: glutathione transferase GstA [Hyphomonadaceae bacterium]